MGNQTADYAFEPLIILVVVMKEAIHSWRQVSLFFIEETKRLQDNVGGQQITVWQLFWAFSLDIEKIVVKEACPGQKNDQVILL